MDRLTLLGGGGASGGGSGGGLPVTGLVGWWDASVTAGLSLTGSSINSVADQSGLGHPMTWNGVAPAPTYNATGFNSTKPAMVFDATGPTSLSAASFPMGTGNTLTAWYVGTLGSATSTGSSRALIYASPGQTDWNNVSSWGIYRATSTTEALIRNSTSATSSALTAHPAPYRMIFTINSSGVMTVYANGVSVATATSSGNWISAGTATIGRESNVTNNYWTGPIAEAGIATGYSDATAVAALDLYLKNKWGL